MMKKNELNVLSYGYRPFRFINIPHNIKQFFRNIKYSWQRTTKGYCDADVWNLDLFYIKLISQTIKSFKEQSEDDCSSDEWNQILDTIISDLKSADSYFNNPNDYNEHYDDWNQMIRKRDLMDLIKDKNITERDKDIIEKYCKRNKEIMELGDSKLKEGLTLFTKYLQNFWL